MAKQKTSTSIGKLSVASLRKEILLDPERLNQRIEEIFDYIKEGCTKPYDVECENCHYHQGSHLEMHIKCNAFPAFYQIMRFKVQVKHLLNSATFFQRSFNKHIAEVKAELIRNNVIAKDGSEIKKGNFTEIPIEQFKALEDGKIIIFKESMSNENTLNYFDESDNYVGYIHCHHAAGKINYRCFLETNFLNQLMQNDIENPGS